MNVDEADQRAQPVPLDHSVVEVQVEQQLKQFAARVDLVGVEALPEPTAGIVELIEIGSNESVRAGVGEHNLGFRLVLLFGGQGGLDEQWKQADQQQTAAQVIHLQLTFEAILGHQIVFQCDTCRDNQFDLCKS